MAGVKIFGATIPVKLTPVQEAASVEDVDKEHQGKDFSSDAKEKDQESPTSGLSIDNHASSKLDDAQRTSTDEESPSPKTPNPEEIQAAENNNDQQEKQTPKKPDKILPCPRCNSSDTKFCYFNNYNVNQPRYFCKNCQRYWTAGGNMRNVPVGAGRRKNKSSCHRNNMVLHDIATLQSLQSNSILANSSSIQLSFGSDAPLCDSMASVLNLADKTMKNGICNGYQKPQDLKLQLPSVENVEEPSSASSITATNSTEEGKHTNSNHTSVANGAGLPPAIPCYNGAPWPYPWAPTPPFCAPSFPILFYPTTAYWGVPWVAPLASPSSNGSSVMSSSSSSHGPNSPTLGKHLRDGTVLNHSSTNSSENGDAPKEINQEGGIWIPKTLRMDDPEAAAKSSIWASIGINKKEKTDCGSTAGFFKALQTKEGMNCHLSSSGASKVLHANPAAFSRSLSFQESS